MAEREYFMASACTGAGSRCKSNRELRAATRALVSRGTTSYIFVCSRNILTPDCVLTRTQGNRSAEGGREKKKNLPGGRFNFYGFIDFERSKENFGESPLIPILFPQSSRVHRARLVRVHRSQRVPSRRNPAKRAVERGRAQMLARLSAHIFRNSLKRQFNLPLAAH